MQFELVVLPGDGVGPDVTTEGVQVLEAVGKRFDHRFKLHYGLVGGVAIDKEGTGLSEDTVKICRDADAVLLGAVGGPKWDDPLVKVHPEDGLLALRKELGLFANLRPVKVSPVLVNSTNLKPEVIRGVDLIFVRELTGGLYFADLKGSGRHPGGGGLPTP